MEKELRIKAISGILYNSFAKVVTYLLRIGANVILAQNLGANDYGVVGFAMIIVAFLSRFNDLGLGSAVVQKTEVDQGSLYTAFSIKFILGTLICIFCIILAPAAKHFFDHPEIDLVIRVLAIILFISSFSFLPEAVLTRELQYKKIALANILSILTRSMIAIALVLMGFKYWSLVWAEVGAALVQTLALRYFRRTKIVFRLEVKTAVRFISFGGRVFLAGLATFLIFNADNFIIGTFGGLTLLGFYALAFNWASAMCGVLSDTIGSVLFPTLSKMQKDREGIKRAYIKVLEYTGFVGIIGNVTLTVNAKEIFVFVLGRGTDKWIPAVTAFEVLCFYGMIRIVLEPVGNVLLALGKPGILLRANLLAGTLEVSLLYFALRYGGINGVAILVTATYAIQYIIYFPFLKRELGITWSEIAAVIKPALICGFAVMVSAYVIGSEMEFSIASMVAKAVYCVGGYLILYGVLTQWRIFKEARAIFDSRLLAKTNLTQ